MRLPYPLPVFGWGERGASRACPPHDSTHAATRNGSHVILEDANNIGLLHIPW